MFKAIGLLMCCLGLVQMEAAYSRDRTLDDQREAWVIKARQGQLDAGIEGLGKLYAQTGDVRVRDDLMALLVRAERYQKVLDLCLDCFTGELSSAGLEMLGMAARQVNALGKANTYYQALTQRQPDNLQGWLGLALTRIDLGNYAAADRVLQRIEERNGRSADWLQARTYLASSSNDPLMELQTLQWQVERSSGDWKAIQALYRLAVTIGARGGAERLVQRYPEAFNAKDRLWLRYYDARDQLRLAQSANKPVLYQKALEGLNSLLAETEAAPTLIQRVEFDKVQALVKLRRFSEAEAVAAELTERYGELPVYLRQARAEALFGMGRPGDAIAIYWQLVEDNPERAHAGPQPLSAPLFYAYADLQAYDRAERLLADWKAEEPPTHWNFTGTRRMNNPSYEQILNLEMLLEAWRGDIDQAQPRLDDFLHQGPSNPFLWKTQGDFYRWRGWPRQAIDAYERSAQLSSPDDRDAPQHGILMARLDKGQWRGTVERIEHRLEEDLPSVSRDSLERDLRERRAGGLTISGSTGQGNGSGVQSTRDWQFTTRVETPRADDGGRFFAERIAMFGEYFEQDLRAAYTTIGYQFPLYPADFSFSVGQGAQLSDAPLLRGELNLAVNDHWSTSLKAEKNTAQTPLRALNDGFSADLYQVSLNYHRDESGAGSVGLSLMDVEDGNLRRSLTGHWREILYQYDEWRVAGEVYAGTSRNEDVPASYFNPERDVTLSGKLDIEHRTPLDYRQSFVQGLNLGTGRYWQEDEAAANTWQIGYQHRWELAPTLDLEYGIRRDKSVYDGDAELSTVFSIGLDWRLP